MNEEIQLADYFAILRRWKKIFLAVTFVLFSLSLAFALQWSKYQSTAVVQIDPAEIAASATTPTGAPQQDQLEALADQRISSISQKVLSTGTLIEVISKFELYKSERSHAPIADVALAMSKKIKIDLVSGDLANPAAAGRVSADNLAAIAFKLSFTYSNPLTAQQVTDELVNRFLDEDLKERRTQAQETADFLGAQIDDLEKTISEQEKKIADFEKENGVSRPESLAFNQQAAATLTLDLQNLDSQMMANEGTTGSLRAQLAGVDPYARVATDGQVLTTPTIQLKALRSQYASLTAQYGPEHPDVVKVRHQIEALEKQTGATATSKAQLKAQIADLQTNLTAAKQTYGAEHPDVIALKDQIQNLEDQLKSGKSQAVAKNGIITDADNPTYLQFAAQLNAAEEQHKALVNQRAELKAQQAAYQKAVMANPEAAKEMAALTRDYENAQQRFRELKEKKMAADMTVKMQEDRKGQRMTLIDPPQLPQGTHPARLLILLGGIGLSLIGGLCAVIIAQFMSQSIVGARHLESIVGVAPLVSIPHIYTMEERALQGRTFGLWSGIAKRLRLISAR